MEIMAAVAYINDSSDTEYSEIWTVAETEPRRVLSLPRSVGLISPQVALSPDGTKIAYAHMVGQQQVSIAVLDLNSGTIEELIDLQLTVPGLLWTPGALNGGSWSANNQWIHSTLLRSASSSDTGERVDVILNADNELPPWELPVDDYFLSWVPGKPNTFAVLSGSGADMALVVRSAIDHNIRQVIIPNILSLTLSDSYKNGYGAFSYDGRYLALVANDTAYEVHICDIEAIRCWPVNIEFDFPVLVAWSPDSSWLAYYDDASYAMSIEPQPQQWIVPESKNDSTIEPLGWSSNGVLVYRRTNQLWEANPGVSEEVRLLLDLSKIDAAGKPGPLSIGSLP